MKKNEDMDKALQPLREGSPEAWPKSFREMNLYGAVPAQTEEKILEAIRTAQLKKRSPARGYFIAAAASVILAVGSLVVWKQFNAERGWEVKAAEKTLGSSKGSTSLAPIVPGQQYSGELTVLPAGYADVAIESMNVRIEGPATLTLGRDINVIQGILWVRGAGGSHAAKIITPTVTLEMTGTAGRISVLSTGTKIDVLEGEFKGQAGTAVAEIKAGQSLESRPNDIGKPEAIPPEMRATLDAEFAIIRSGGRSPGPSEEEEVGQITLQNGRVVTGRFYTIGTDMVVITKEGTERFTRAEIKSVEVE